MGPGAQSCTVLYCAVLCCMVLCCAALCRHSLEHFQPLCEHCAAFTSNVLYCALPCAKLYCRTVHTARDFEQVAATDSTVHVLRRRVLYSVPVGRWSPLYCAARLRTAQTVANETWAGGWGDDRGRHCRCEMRVDCCYATVLYCRL